MKKNQARQHIRGHELAATRNPLKRKQHELAAQLLRKEHGIPAPVSFGGHIGRDHAAQMAEQSRINKWKESR